jgi:hypothetical protein
MRGHGGLEMLEILLSAAVAVAALYGLDRLGLWAERRGWIYYRHRKASPGSVGTALLQVHSLMEPQQRHVLEARLDEEVDLPGAGAPPGPDRRREA